MVCCYEDCKEVSVSIRRVKILLAFRGGSY